MVSRIGVLAGFALVLASQAVAEIVPFLVPTRSIAAGEELKPSDFTTKVFEISAQAKLRYVLHPDQLRGAVAARPLPRMKPMTLQALRPAALIKKGEQRQGRLTDSGIEITTLLIAEEDGAAGTIIKAKNSVSNIVVDVRVLQDGTLALDSP
jgi:flagellar basal body P-ring formation protein FlgA